MLLNGMKLLVVFPQQPPFFIITAGIVKMTSNEYPSCTHAKNDTGDTTYSGFIKGNGVIFAGSALLSEVCIL